MCEYLENAFRLLQVGSDMWVSKLFFAKVFGRKERNRRALSVRKYQSLSKDADYVQRVPEDDDGSIIEAISSNIDSEELSTLCAEAICPSLYHEATHSSSSSKCDLHQSEYEEDPMQNELASMEPNNQSLPGRKRRCSAKAHSLSANYSCDGTNIDCDCVVVLCLCCVCVVFELCLCCVCVVFVLCLCCVCVVFALCLCCVCFTL